jgi:chorismate lyase / 3-hydroxybenzoate synthase
MPRPARTWDRRAAARAGWPSTGCGSPGGAVKCASAAPIARLLKIAPRPPYPTVTDTARATLHQALTIDYESDAAGGLGSGAGAILARIDHGSDHVRPADAPWRLTLGLRPLSAPDALEVWRVPLVRDAGWEDGIGHVASADCLFAHLLVQDDWGSDLGRLAWECYERLLGLVRRRGFPHPWRIWNFLPDIHRSVDGLERYRGFCVGRDRALREAGLDEAGFPAATAIGATAPGLLVYLLAGRVPGRPVENPRQVSAYRYPPRYGPRPPAFARGLLLPPDLAGRRLLVSGTASVVGHRSCHPGDISGQLRETLTNLESLADAAGLKGRWQAGDTAPLLKVYLRDPGHRSTVAVGIERWSAGRARVVYLQGEVCREDLAIEIEGVL